MDQLIEDKLKEKFHSFLISNLYPPYEEFNNKLIHFYLNRGKDIIIFSYESEEEKLIYEQLASNLYFIKDDLLLLIHELKSLKEEEEYYMFNQEKGVYLIMKDFFKEERIDLNKDLLNVNNFINKYEEVKDNKIKINSFRNPIYAQNGKDKEREGKKNYTPKIVESLEEERKEEEQIKPEEDLYKKQKSFSPSPNTKNSIKKIIKRTQKNSSFTFEEHITILTINFLVYSFFFYLIYTKYFNHHIDVSKEN
jgi:hypothetical protein